LFCLLDELRRVLGGSGRRQEEGGDGYQAHREIILGALNCATVCSSMWFYMWLGVCIYRYMILR
jgi:hypothetical protein